jgi:hypothetical protein
MPSASRRVKNLKLGGKLFRRTVRHKTLCCPANRITHYTEEFSVYTSYSILINLQHALFKGTVA